MICGVHQCPILPATTSRLPHCPACDAGAPSIHPPTEPTTAEAFDAIRTALRLVQAQGLAQVGEYYSAVNALDLLERRMQGSPPLAVLVEGFCSEVENARFSREARKSGGQTTGTVSPFEHVQPSVAMALERWARDFRKALADV